MDKETVIHHASRAAVINIVERNSKTHCRRMMPNGKDLKP